MKGKGGGEDGGEGKGKGEREGKDEVRVRDCYYKKKQGKYN